MNNNNTNGTNNYRYISSTKYLDVTVISCLMVVGTCGNVLILLSIFINSKLRKFANVFIINLAIADLVITTYIEPLMLVATITEEFPAQVGWCQFTAYVTSCSCGMSILNMASIAVNRYVYICKNHKYHHFFTRRSVATIVLISWLWCLLACSPQVLGWSETGFSSNLEAVFFSREQTSAILCFYW